MNRSAYSGVVWPWQEQAGFPWPHLQFYHDANPYPLDSGESLPQLVLAFEEWGDPASPPIIIFHALTGDSRVTGTDGDRVGWWQEVVGAGKAVDPAQYHVVSANVLGGAMGSLGPASLDADGRPYGSRFPEISVFDMARATHQLIEALGIDRPALLIGGSMGGMVALAYGALYPAATAGVLCIGSPIRHSDWAISFHAVGRAAILADPAFCGGDYYASGHFPSHGLALARMVDMISYQSPESMSAKFGRKFQTPARDEFQVSSYLRYQGNKLVRRFDANTYLRLTEAMDRFDLRPEHMRALQDRPVWMVGIASDVLYPAAEIREHTQILRDHGVATRYEELSGRWGHDTFLVDQTGTGRIVSQFLQAAGGRAGV